MDKVSEIPHSQTKHFKLRKLDVYAYLSQYGECLINVLDVLLYIDGADDHVVDVDDN